MVGRLLNKREVFIIRPSECVQRQLVLGICPKTVSIGVESSHPEISEAASSNYKSAIGDLPQAIRTDRANVGERLHPEIAPFRVQPHYTNASGGHFTSHDES